MTDLERKDLLYTLSPLAYVRALGLDPYPWQAAYLESTHKSKVLNGARRGGKSFIISSKPCHKAKYYPGSLSLILAYRLDQAEEDIRYVKRFIGQDPGYPGLIRDNGGELELANGSRIVAVPASEEAARGYPDPDIIIVDEAAFVPDIIFTDCLYPMLNGNPRLEFNFISTPHGKMADPGRFFFEAFANPTNERYEIRAPWDIDPNNNMNLIPAMPEAEYRKMRAKEGIKAFYSERHAELSAQLKILERGEQAFRQNNLVEFIESENNAFRYSDIDRAFNYEMKPIVTSDIPEMVDVNPFLE
jgi:hypothetical protein